MPWKVEDVDSKIKGLSPDQKKAWVKIANSVLKACKAKGESDCEGRAVRIANAKAKGTKSEVDAYINSLSFVNFNSSLKTKELKDIKTEETAEGLLIKDLPVFKAGTYRDTIYSEDYIDRNFIGQFNVDEDIPVQADHNPSVFATLGWVKNLQRKAKIMYADFLLTDDNAIARWKKGLLKKFSIGVNILEDKIREISIVAFPYVKSARVHGESFDEDIHIEADEINGSYFVTIEEEQFEIKKDTDDMWMLFPISRRDENGEIQQEEELNIMDEDIDNIDVKDVSSDEDLTLKHRNSLPDSSFLLIRRPVKNKNGDRTLPIKDKDGKISNAFVKKSLTEIDRIKGFAPEMVKKAKLKLERIVKKLGVKTGSKGKDMDMSRLKDIDVSKLEDGKELFKEVVEYIGTIEKERDALKESLSEIEKVKKELDIKLKAGEVAEAVGKLKTAGKITPAQEENVGKFMLTLDTEARAGFIAVIASGKSAVDLSENGNIENDDPNAENKNVLDTEKLDAVEINKVAEKLAKDEDIDFHEALDLCHDGKVSKSGKLI